jgi:ornithine carbamoyltransferase
MDNFLNISDLSSQNLRKILDIETNNSNFLKNKSIGMIFEKYSTRTRLSFNVGISQLGGNSVDIKFEELNISREESFEDTFKAMNCYLDGLVYRTSDHSKLINASKYFKRPIINALSDLSHPCQALSDLYTLKESFNSLDVSVLWIGDMNNVCFSLLEVANLIEEFKLTICSPREISDNLKWNTNSNINIVNKISDIDLSSIQCVMTDVFISMNDQENEAKVNLLKDYIVNDDLMAKTSKDSIFMHCLPAKVGFEVSKSVFESSKSIVWRQAYNRMIAQKKLLQFINWD